MLDGTLLALGSLVLAAQMGLLGYCIKIEHRLTRIETIVSIRREIFQEAPRA